MYINHVAKNLFNIFYNKPLEIVQEAVELIKKSGKLFLVNQKDSSQNTPLHIMLNKLPIKSDATVAKKIINDLIELGSELNGVNKAGWTPLHLAVKNRLRGDFSIIERLLEAGADINAPMNKNYGRTVLTQVASSNYISKHTDNIELIEFLINNGANVNTYSSPRKNAEESSVEKGTPFFHIVLTAPALDEEKIKKMFFLLLSKGLIIDDKDYFGNTLLATLCLNNNNISESEIEKKRAFLLKLSIEHGADADSVNKRGASPLLLACENTGLDLIDILIDNGADVFAKDKEGKNAFDYIQENKLHKNEIPKMIERLKNAQLFQKQTYIDDITFSI